jgi:hypothetical protein
MEQENNNTKCCADGCGSDCGDASCCGKKKISGCASCGGGVYGLAFVGAVIYYIQHAETFWMGVLGFFKALVWPAIIVYKLLEFFAK